MLEPCDIENEVAIALSEVVSCSATPLPRDFARSLPYCLITQTGGRTQDRVLDTFGLSLDIYAPLWSQAKATANQIVAYLRTLEGTVQNDITWYGVDIESLPYNNPDPNHEDIPRCTIYMTLSIRELER